MSKEDAPETGMAVYDGAAEDIILKAARDKKLKAAVKKDASTDGDNLEKKRQEVGALHRIARSNINRISALMLEKSSAKDKDRLKEINAEIENLFMQNRLFVDFAQLSIQCLTFDALTIRDEEALPDGRKVHTRVSLADMYSRTIDDDESAINFFEKDDLALLMEMVHCLGKAVGELISRLPARGPATPVYPVFQGDVVDESGVPARVEDKIEWLKKKNMEQQAKDQAEYDAQEAAERLRRGVTEEEAKKIEGANNFDDLFGANNNGGGK